MDIEKRNQSQKIHTKNLQKNKTLQIDLTKKK